MEDSLFILYILTPILLIIIGIIIYLVVRRKFISKNLKQCIDDQLKIAPFLEKMSVKRLSLYSSLVEKISSHNDISLPKKIGMDLFWIVKLDKNPTCNNLKRVLRFCSENGIYSAFLSCLKREKLRPIFLNYIQEQKFEILLNALAKKSYKSDFDGLKASVLFDDHLAQIASLADSSSPEDRWFSFKIMAVLDDSHKFGMVKWNAFSDHSFEIRRMIIEEINSNDDEQFYNNLFSRLINDTDRSIRIRVKEIIASTFIKMYKPNFDALSGVQKIRFCENLFVTIELDKKIALDNILSKNLELKHLVAHYLDRTDALKKLLLSVDINDPSRIKYAVNILNSALEVNASLFLNSIKFTKNPGSLLCAAQLLIKLGDKKYISELAIAVFDLSSRNEIDSLSSQLYKETLDCIQLRGDEKSQSELKKEILHNRYNDKLTSLLLMHLPEDCEIVFKDMIFSFLYNPDFKNRSTLLDVCTKLPQQMIVSEMINILKSEKSLAYDIRLNAIEYFKIHNIELCFQYVLENLDFFPENSSLNAIKQLYDYSSLLFKETVENIVATEDNRSVPFLLKILYITKEISFIKLIEKQLENSSSQIRKAAIEALYLFKYDNLFNVISPLLNDSDKDVRLLTAKMMSASANKSEIEEVKTILLDENELKIVKKSIIVGLGKSSNHSSINTLLLVVDSDPFLFDQILIALLKKECVEYSNELVRLYFVSKEQSKKIIIQYFRNKGLLAEEILLEYIKKSKNLDVIKYSKEILYKTGYIDKIISQLRNKSAEVRISALNKLLIIDTVHAHKGIVLAARDNNKAIRKVACDRFEEMVKKENSTIEQLQKDPSRMVQKNINWILNKLEKNKVSKVSKGSKI